MLKTLSLVALFLFSLSIHSEPAPRIQINFSGTLHDICEYYPNINCAVLLLDQLINTEFSGSLIIPYNIGEDQYPDDLDFGFYTVSENDGYVEFNAFGDNFDMTGNTEIHIGVQDCHYDPGCPNKNNFVWITFKLPAVGIVGIDFFLQLNGTSDEFGPGPQSDQLPDIPLLQEIADYGGAVEIITENYSEAVITPHVTPSVMDIEIFATSSHHPIPIPFAFQVALGLLLVIYAFHKIEWKRKIDVS